MRLFHLDESVSRPGRMWPSRTRVTCGMSRQKMEKSSSTARSACSLRVSFSSSWETWGQKDQVRAPLYLSVSCL